MERIFIAIDFFKEVQESLERLRAPLDFARWTHPQDLHLTLNFIGDVQIQQTHEIVHFLEEIDFTSFRLRPKGVDVFGPLERPKSLFANVQSDEYLLQLQELIGQQMAKAMPGIARDKRRFLPHITLARFQFANEASVALIGPYLQANSLYQGPLTEIKSFALFRSRNKVENSGPRYQLIQRFELL